MLEENRRFTHTKSPYGLNFPPASTGSPGFSTPGTGTSPPVTHRHDTVPTPPLSSLHSRGIMLKRTLASSSSCFNKLCHQTAYKLYCAIPVILKRV